MAAKLSKVDKPNPAPGCRWSAPYPHQPRTVLPVFLKMSLFGSGNMFRDHKFYTITPAAKLPLCCHIVVQWLEANLL